MDENKNLIEFQDVTKSYDGRTAVLDRLTLRVHAGDFISLLGPSGSGKTTALMLLAGFETPTAGSILLDGQDITRLPPHRRGMGVVFQNYALFPHMTLAENVAYPLRLRRLAGAELSDRVHKALSMVKLSAFRDRKPGQVSGGQQQRTALARALVFEPRVVLMDEPLGALDKSLRDELQHEIKSLHRLLGMTFVYVTHDQAEALTMSDRVAVFEGGRIRQVDTPRMLYERPADLFVARFFGEASTLAGVVRRITDGRCEVELPTGEWVTGEPVNGALEAGSPVTLCVRPGQVRLESVAGAIAGSRGSGDGRLNVTIRSVDFLGDRWRLLMATGDGQPLLAYWSTFSRAPLADDRILVQLESHDVRVFPRESPTVAMP